MVVLRSNELLAMSNLVSTDTGIDGVVVRASAAAALGGGDTWRGPCIRVVIGDKIAPEEFDAAIAVTLTYPPEFSDTIPDSIISDVVKFIALNRAVLLRYWNNEISTRQMIDGINKID